MSDLPVPPPPLKFLDALYAYMEKFDDAPTIMGLPESLHTAVAVVLYKAVRRNRPFATDAEFMRALGSQPVPDDVDV